MANFDIYVLGESQLTISGGQLDGVVPGDGSHLLGRRVTLGSQDWRALAISDSDGNFAHRGGDQRLIGAQFVDGVGHASGARVAAKYGLTLSDGARVWTVVGFNVGDCRPVIGMITGLAFVGGPGGFPPADVQLTVTGFLEGSNIAVTDCAMPICLVGGTRVATPQGERPVEEIAVGDAVRTRDHGLRVVRRLSAAGGFATVEFAPGAVGNTRVLRVSQQHRVLVTGWRAELLFGVDEALVPAVHLVNGAAVRRGADELVSYHHLLLDDRALICTEGCWGQSFHPGVQGFDGPLPSARTEMLALFSQGEAFGATHTVARARAARLML